MASKSATIYTARDQQIHEALALTPLDTQQLLRLSETFDQPFTSDRKLRDRHREVRYIIHLDNQFHLAWTDGSGEIASALDALATTRK